MQVNILDAIFWTKGAWGKVSRPTISNCFKKCGIDSSIEMVRSGEESVEYEHEIIDLGPLLGENTLEEYASIGRYNINQ